VLFEVFPKHKKFKGSNSTLLIADVYAFINSY